MLNNHKIVQKYTTT